MKRQAKTRHTTPALTMPHMADYFSPTSLLARVIPGYEPREGQVQLAQAMADAITTKQHLIGEAGTGTGKALAYLMAIAASGAKAIVSTHTKALQQQLAEQEIPRLQHVFPDLKAAVLKGRSNYACVEHMHRVQTDERQKDLFVTQSAAVEYTKLLEWLSTDGTHGDLDQLPFGISDELREKVTVDGYGCLGRKCPFLAECYSQQAKEHAAQAQIVIVNHSLLLLDLFLGKSVGLLPTHPVVVVDEAHALEQTATQVFGAELTAGRWRVIERKVGALADHTRERLRGTAFGEIVLDRIVGLEPKAAALTAQAEAWYARLTEEMQDAKVRNLEGFLHEALSQAGVALYQSTRTLGRTMETVKESLKSGTDEADAIDAERWGKLADLCERTAAWIDLALGTGDAEAETPMVRYIERSEGRGRQGVTLHVKPIRVSQLLEEYLWNERIVLATSATLATGKQSYQGGDPFTYWRDRVGAEGGTSLVLPSPFPFRVATRLYVPRDVEAFDPTKARWNDTEAQEHYHTRVIDETEALLAIKRGGAFVLCTSHRMLRLVAERLHETSAHTIYVQGQAPPIELLRQFKHDGEGVLIGTRTFWEGVDVPGEALQLVIIDRIPFGVPDDPLWEARCKDVGEAWFSDLALPTTLLALKQAFGRLMRRMDDIGVVAILDTRLRSKSYGTWLLKGLPPAPLVGDLKEVQHFFETC